MRKKQKYYSLWTPLALVVLFIFPFSTEAEISTSASFQILDSEISIGAGRSTSASFILLNSLNDISLGTSSATSFQLTPGFLAFPEVSTPVVTPVSDSSSDSPGVLGTAAPGTIFFNITNEIFSPSPTGNVSSTDTSSISNSISSTLPLTRTLRIGMTGIKIFHLQKLLNSDPDTQIASSGDGSPGQETDYFGALTMDAVKRFQAKYGIVSSGDEDSTGYGLVGPSTRDKLNELLRIARSASAPSPLLTPTTPIVTQTTISKTVPSRISKLIKSLKLGVVKRRVLDLQKLFPFKLDTPTVFKNWLSNTRSRLFQFFKLR